MRSIKPLRPGNILIDLSFSNSVIKNGIYEEKFRIFLSLRIEKTS